VEHIRRSRLSARDDGLRRAGRITGWATVGSGVAMVAIASVLAGGQAQAASDPQPPSAPAPSSAPNTTPKTTPGTGTGLQPPTTVPHASHGRGSHITSGSS
jgi:hypothetical protein